MRILKGTVGVVLVWAVMFVAGGLLLPDRAHVERSIDIDRAPLDVHAVVNGFGRFNEWSPWAEQDPTAQYTFDGPEEGVGARMAWTGVQGDGSQQITASSADAIDVALDFGSDGLATAGYRLQPADSGTRLTWTLDVDAQGSLVGRWFGLLLDRLVGPDYERGLAKLKGLLEGEAPAASGHG